MRVLSLGTGAVVSAGFSIAGCGNFLVEEQEDKTSSVTSVNVVAGFFKNIKAKVKI